MGLGDCMTFCLDYIGTDPNGVQSTLALPDSTTKDCCFTLPVLASTTDDDPFKNDFNGPIFFFNNGFTTAVLKLEKFEGGIWVEKADLVDDTYGTFFSYGFDVNQFSESLFGYRVQWRTVLAAFSPGDYRVKAEGTTIFGGDPVVQYSFEYCVQEYTTYRANKTVRIEYTRSGIIGDSSDDQLIKDFGVTEWVDQIRLPNSTFGNDKGNREQELKRFGNGALKYTKDFIENVVTLETSPLPYFLRTHILFDVMQSEMLITAYDKNSPVEHINRAVESIEGFEPEYLRGTQFASLVLEFKRKYQNLDRKRC